MQYGEDTYNPGQKCWNTCRPIFEIASSPPGSMLKHTVLGWVNIAWWVGGVIKV